MNVIESELGKQKFFLFWIETTAGGEFLWVRARFEKHISPHYIALIILTAAT